MGALRKLGIALIALILLAVPGYAADEDAEHEGLPAYSVTRLKIYDGVAWVRTPDSGDWEEFSTNSPVPARSMISIPDGSEAELQFHGGQFVLLTAGTELYLQGIEDDRTAFRLRSGEIRFYLPEYDFAPVRVTVPAGGKTEFLVPGRYWLTVSDGGETTLVVREGEGTIQTERGEFQVRTGDQASIGNDVQIGRYSGDDRDAYEEPPPLLDAEKQADVPPAAAYELREYGEWVRTDEYGYVWRPRVSPGWSPYYYGRWEWISPYGWTWISYEPWGWYPYHYGYWYVDPFFGWVWYPFHSFVSVSFLFGHTHFSHFHRHVRFVPANVRFVRDGRSVRWVPLRPGERTRRIPFTRSDSRLSGWERPLERGTVFVRPEGSRSREWRDWTAVRRERREAARTDATLRTGGGRKGPPVVRTVPARREREVEGSIRGKGERPQEKGREIDRSRRESPAGRKQWERITPPSSRPERRSEVRPERTEKATRGEKYGSRGRQRISPPGVAPAQKAGRPSPQGATRGEKYGSRGRQRVSPPGVAPAQKAVRPSPPQRREGREAAPRYRAMPSGHNDFRGSERRAAPVGGERGGRSSGVRSSVPNRLDGARGGAVRGGGRGLFGFGTGGGRGGRSVR